MKKTQEEIAVGTRLECDGHRGTVLFVGEVPPTKGVWLGIEWDDPSRGKHDGLHEGHRYFSTSEPGAGSFVRAQKVNFGVGLLQAIKERYGLVEDENAGINPEDMYVYGKNQQTVVEVVGARSVNLQQSQLNQLKDVAVRDCLVNGIKNEILTNNLPRVETLDLSSNLLSSWQEVAELCSQLNRLSKLSISKNILKFPEKPEELKTHFDRIDTIYLNRMKYSWEQVVTCCTMMRNLQQLHVCFNRLNQLSSLLSLVPNLRLVNLESNPIKEWKNILSLGDLACLESLILNDCELTCIEFPDTPTNQKTTLFPKLHTLCIAQNKIDKWSYINELNKLQNLKDLKIQFNPLLEDKTKTHGTIRTLFIAKILSLDICNRTVIAPVERRGAELDYLKIFGKDWKQAGGDQDPTKNNPSQEFIDEHPNYAHFIQVYGAPEDSELKQHSTALSHNLITVTIDCPDYPDKGSRKKKLPLTMSVQKLKVLIKRLFKLNDCDISLTYSSLEMEGQIIEFEWDNKEIGYYSVEEGDTIHVKW